MIVTLRPPVISTAIVGLVATSLLPAHAQTTHVWSGGSVPLGNRNWTSAGNWVGGVPPKNFNTADVILTGSYPTSQTLVNNNAPIVDEPWPIRSLKLDALVVLGATMQLTGEPLTIGPGGMEFSGSSIDVHNTIRIRRDQTWLDNDGFTRDVRFVNDLEFLTPGIVAPYTVTVAGNKTRLKLPANITGEGTFRITGDMDAELGTSGQSRTASQIKFEVEDDSYIFITDATYTVDQIRPIGTGELLLLGEQALMNTNSLQGSGKVIFSSLGTGDTMATLNHQGVVNESFQGRLVGDSLARSTSTSPSRGRLIKSGPAQLTLNRAGTAGDLLHLDLTGGSLTLNNTNLTSAKLTGTATLDCRSGSTFTLTGAASSNFGGSLTGGGRMTIENSHALTLDGVSTPHELGLTTLDGSLTLDHASFYTGNLTGAGTTTFGQASELRITGNESTNFTGLITHNGTTNAPNGLLVVLNPVTFTLDGPARQHSFASLALGEGAILNVANNSELLVRSYSGSAGTLRLSQNSTAFLVENTSFGFPLKIDAADGNVTIPVGARFQLDSPGKTHSIGHLDISNRGLDLAGASSLSLGKLSGSVALSINSGSALTLGDFHLSPFSGAFINGTNGGGSLQLTSAGTKVLRAGGFTGSTTLGGSTAAIYQSLPGTAPNGPLTVSSGVKLEAANINNTSVNLDGVLEIRSVPSPDGPVHGGCATGTFSQSSGSRTILTINDRPTRPLGFGKVVASGNISLSNAAVIEVNFNNTFGAQVGDSWTLFSTTGGSFSQVNLPANRTINATNLPANTQLVWAKTPTALSLQLVSTITDPPGYYTWATANNLTPANRGPFLDPDNDGIPNWREYLLALNPLGPGQPTSPTHETRIEAGQPIVRFRLPSTLDFTTDFEVQGSADLGSSDSWSSTKATFLGNGTLPGGMLYRDYRFHLLPASALKGFLRIRYKGLTSHPND